MKTALHANPFFVLQVTTRDNSRKIVEAAEERSLLLDHDICQKARSDLTNPRTRLAAEIAWMPGVAPSLAEKLAAALSDNPMSARGESGLPQLARANLMAAAFDLVEDGEPAESIADFILDFAWVVESIGADEVVRDINEDRAISGFPEVRSSEMIEDELAGRRAVYRSILKNLLSRLAPTKLIDTMTEAVSVATDDGNYHGPSLLDDLVDSYEVETQGFLQKEYDNIAALILGAKKAAPSGEAAVSTILDTLERVTKNWDRVAQPIQVSAKSRGTVHRQSRDVAFELRDLGVVLCNEHSMLEQAHRLTELLSDVFAELPDVAERLGEDAEALAGLRRQAEEQKVSDAEWARSITFRAEVGVMFKDELAISADGIRWKGKNFPLNSITRVRWGGIRKSVNGIPTGTDYTIAFGGDRYEQVISIRKELTYTGFIEALWRAVCVRIMIETLDALSQGRSLSFGDIIVEDSAVTLVKRKFLGSNQKVRLSWNDVSVWSADGNFLIGQRNDKRCYGESSYIEIPNTHILEHIIRSGFKKGVNKLSDYLRG